MNFYNHIFGSFLTVTAGTEGIEATQQVVALRQNKNDHRRNEKRNGRGMVLQNKYLFLVLKLTCACTREPLKQPVRCIGRIIAPPRQQPGTAMQPTRLNERVCTRLA